MLTYDSIKQIKKTCFTIFDWNVFYAFFYKPESRRRFLPIKRESYLLKFFFYRDIDSFFWMGQS